MRLVAYRPHGPPPGPVPRSRSSRGSDARHRSPYVIFGFAEFALFFPINMPNDSTSPGVDRSRLDQSGFSPVQSKIFLDRDRTSPDFRGTGAD